MHKVFGRKCDAPYLNRKGAYVIPFHEGKIAVIRTPKGYFFIGGGLLEMECDSDCILRECIEETGYGVEVQQKICSAETFTFHPQLGYFHPIQTYYCGLLTEKKAEPIETDHSMVWGAPAQLQGKMFSEMQNWALSVFAQQADHFESSGNYNEV